MQTLIAVAIGGAAGALGRYWIAGLFNGLHDRLPTGTLICNLLGSFIMGVLFVLIMEKARLAPELRPTLMVGFLGAFTTFSSFALETVTLFEKGHIMSALIYVLFSVILSISAVTAGIWITRLI